jgi:hypothetical protein
VGRLATVGDGLLQYGVVAPRIALRVLIWIGLCQIRSIAADDAEWIPFDPSRDSFAVESAIDLRYLNETFAGENGRIEVAGDHFVHAATGEPVRFWSVNVGPKPHLRMDEWRYLARLLAKYGINHVRLHGGVNHAEQDSRRAEDQHRDNKDVSAYRIEGLWRAVAAFKEQGIYSHLSIYFPYWIKFGPDDPDFPGYTGTEHTFGIFFFNPKFIELYRGYWEALLLPQNPHTGVALKDDPAVMGVEILNEDSMFFWTLGYDHIPLPQMELLEARFGEWLAEKYGSRPAAAAAWAESPAHERDAWEAGRVGIAALWDMKTRGSTRDFDQIEFFFELQLQTYENETEFIKALGYPGLITAGNWITIDDTKFDALERATYLGGDFIDHHNAYYNGHHSGHESEWALRDEHRFSHRSLLQFDPKDPADDRRDFELPMAKPTWNGKPTMLSETTWLRPNRFRTEAMPLYAAYGSLHGLDTIVHFVFDSSGAPWSTKPRFHMQPFSWQSPAMFGQSPATALLYRQGMVQEAPPATRVSVRIDEQLRLQGMPYAPTGGIDGLRAANFGATATTAENADAFDPLRLFVAPMSIDIDVAGSESGQDDLSRWIDRAGKRVRSLTAELSLDWGDAVFRIDAAQVQAMVVTQPQLGPVETSELSITSDLAVFSLIWVALDGKPLTRSKRMLLQVMSEERNHGFTAEPIPGDPSSRLRIVSVGGDPWEIRAIQGAVIFNGPPVRVTALDLHGLPVKQVAAATRHLTLRPDTVYYLLERD